MAHLTLILGGVRSGKSGLAEKLAATYSPVTYLATAQAGDAEMAERIARHRRRRAQMPTPWHTVEEPWYVGEAIETHGGAGCILVECLTLWLTNLLVGLPERAAQEDERVRASVTNLAEVAQRVPARVIVVSNETGCGIMPMNALARRFGDLLGESNQCLAAAAAEVYGCLAGIPLRVK